MKPLQLLDKLTSQLSGGWLDCEEPESIAICIDIDQVDEDMLQAIKTCIISDLPWADPYVFENIVDGLNGTPVIPETLTTPPVEDICLAVHIMSIIKPDNEFSSDVAKYICSCAMSEGLVWVPEILLFASMYLPDTDTGLQSMVIESIETSGWPVFDASYTESPLDIQLQKLGAIDKAFREAL